MRISATSGPWSAEASAAAHCTCWSRCRPSIWTAKARPGVPKGRSPGAPRSMSPRREADISAAREKGSFWLPIVTVSPCGVQPR